MAQSTHIITRVADGAIAAWRIVKHGSSDGEAAQASAATDAVYGVCGELAAADGERVDIVIGGIAYVEFGGTVAAGGLVTADADGKAVAAAPAAGVNNRVIGQAMESAVAGDIRDVLLIPHQIQGA